jgi:hypothetical protein
VDHQEAGVGVRRAQPIVAALLLVGALGAAAYADRELEPRPFGDGVDGAASSGAWFCPHGGGPEGWEVFLQIANPGPESATVRVRSLGNERSSEPQDLRVEPGSSLQVPTAADGRGRSSMVEWFGQWVAVGWVAHAGGGEGGVAAEPCAPTAGDRWFLPDGSTEVPEGSTENVSNDEFVVVMNPFARQAVFSLTLLSERKAPVQQSELTDVVLKPFRSVAFELGDVVLGERTVSTLIEVSAGRVAAATLGVSVTGGIRSALGYLGTPPEVLTFPGGGDAGRTELVVMNGASAEEGSARLRLEGEILGTEGIQPFVGLAEASLPPGSARTFPATTSGASAVRLQVSGADAAAVRRTYGVVSDQAAITGAEPASAWLILPAVAGSPSVPGLVLSNPGAETITVTLSYLAPGPAEPIEVSVPPGSTIQAPRGFRDLAPDAAVLATSTDTFVPASSSYSLGREGFATFAAAIGIPVPA